MLELYAEDEDSSPVTKKVRFDGAALADANEGGGGRKKAKVSGKKNVRKPIEEEWDGVPRGFGEY